MKNGDHSICDFCGKVFFSQRNFKFCSKTCSAKGFDPEIRRSNGVKSAKRNRPLAGLDHPLCKTWSLRDPQGREWFFKNVIVFVRSHLELFDPLDLNWQPSKPGGKHLVCRASQSLTTLSIRSKKPNPSWKGWTWISVHERRFNDGNDLLDRKEAV